MDGTSRTRRRRARIAAAIAAAIMSVTGVAACGSAAPSSVAPDPSAVAAAITATGLRVHLEALAGIARGNGGSRGTGTAGDDATVAYVAETLQAAGYRVDDDAFETPVYLDPGGSELIVTRDGSPDRAFEDGRDFRAMLFSARLTVEGPVVAIGWDSDARASNGPGCAPTDYAGLPAGSIVLLRPGDCLRRTAVVLAQAAGAAAVVTAVPWAARDEIRQVTLVDAAGLAIPALAASGEVGEALAQAAATGGRARVATTGIVEPRTVRSLLAELPGSDARRVVLVGAHLDSAMTGPGLNDDGSGIAAVLELARVVAGSRPQATIRFAFWAAEEPGLKGSAHYVEALTTAERERIVAYLNADMLGSPNGVRGVYDDADAAPGSTAIRDLFGADLDAAGLTWEPVDTGGSSDHRPFAVAGIPTGGLFAGASGFVTGEQAERYGTQADLPPDPCYHLVCDDLANVDVRRLEELARSLSRVAVVLANEGGEATSPR